MKLIEYIDGRVPVVPMDLLMDFDEILQQDEIDRPRKGTSNYKPKDTNPELQDWLEKQFPPGFILRAKYFVVPGPLNKHRDSNNRLFALNYILDPGGPNVITNVYADDGKTILDSMCIEPFRWHYIVTGMIHSVSNVERPRIGISLSPNRQFQRRQMDRAIGKITGGDGRN